MALKLTQPADSLKIEEFTKVFETGEGDATFDYAKHSYEEIVRTLTSKGFGLSPDGMIKTFRPFLYPLGATRNAYVPQYAKSLEMGIPIIVHLEANDASKNWREQVVKAFTEKKWYQLKSSSEEARYMEYAVPTSNPNQPQAQVTHVGSVRPNADAAKRSTHVRPMPEVPVAMYPDTRYRWTRKGVISAKKENIVTVAPPVGEPPAVKIDPVKTEEPTTADVNAANEVIKEKVNGPASTRAASVETPATVAPILPAPVVNPVVAAAVPNDPTDRLEPEAGMTAIYTRNALEILKLQLPTRAQDPYASSDIQWKLTGRAYFEWLGCVSDLTMVDFHLGALWAAVAAKKLFWNTTFRDAGEYVIKVSWPADALPVAGEPWFTSIVRWTAYYIHHGQCSYICPYMINQVMSKIGVPSKLAPYLSPGVLSETQHELTYRATGPTYPELVAYSLTMTKNKVANNPARESLWRNMIASFLLSCLSNGDPVVWTADEALRKDPNCTVENVPVNGETFPRISRIDRGMYRYAVGTTAMRACVAAYITHVWRTV